MTSRPAALSSRARLVTAIVGEGGQVGVLAGEQLLVLHHITVLEARQFFFQGLGRVPTQLAIQPLQQNLAFRLGGLLLILGRHVFEVDRLPGLAIELL